MKLPGHMVKRFLKSYMTWQTILSKNRRRTIDISFLLTEVPRVFVKFQVFACQPQFCFLTMQKIRVILPSPTSSIHSDWFLTGVTYGQFSLYYKFRDSICGRSFKEGSFLIGGGPSIEKKRSLKYCWYTHSIHLYEVCVWEVKYCIGV